MDIEIPTQFYELLKEAAERDTAVEEIAGGCS